MRSQRSLAWLVAGAVGVAVTAGVLHGSGSRKHQFDGRCQECHVGMPRLGAPYEEVQLTDTVERLCARCHAMGTAASHPVGVAPRSAIPLQRYLDADGRLTCVTCHEVHKEEDRSLDDRALKGLLRGHVRGREFCATCHREGLLGTAWRHEFAVPYAHTAGTLVQTPGGAPLDEFSVECLTCHDGTLSRLGSVDVREGVFRHGVTGPSHPVGVAYPRGGEAREYTDPAALPEGIRLFNGRLGCLSCHSPYSTRRNLLVMDLRGSALCLACHRK